jgi:redox-sensing transcriptional repressor
VSNEVLPEATLIRLHTYRRVLAELAAEGIGTVSSESLARASGVNSPQVRKDLSFVGSRGTRGVGYEVDALRRHLSGALALDRTWRVALIGVGNLGRALAHYAGFAQGGFAIAALLDGSPQVVGTEVAGKQVEPVDDLEAVIERERIDIAVLAVPASSAQPLADRLFAAGISAVLNFAPAHIVAPDEVRVRRVDLSTELGVLAYYERKRLDRRAAVRHAPRAVVDPPTPG